jgi:ABC-type nitrate/sulfonate/bicarbonate transport system substrate-binding protein
MARVRWLAAIGLMLLSACAGGAPPAAVPPSAPAAPAPVEAAVATTAPSPPAPPARMSLVYSTQSAANSPWQLAQDEGIWQRHGLDVESAYAPANIVPTALIQGQAEVVGLSCGEMGLAVVGGADIFQMFAMPNPRLLYMIVARQGITRLEDLRGLRLAMNRPGSAPYVAAKFIFGRVGMDPEQEVTYVTMGGTPERVAALMGGSVDAAILSSDEGGMVAAQPGLQTVVDMSKENVPYCTYGLATSRDYLRAHPELVGRFAKAVVETIARYKLDREASIGAVGRFLNQTDPQKNATSRDSWAQVFPAKPYVNRQAMQLSLDQAGEIDARVRALDPETLIDDRWIRELDASGYIDALYGGQARP